MSAIFTWLASFLTGPIINGAIDAYKAKLSAGNDKDRIAADLAGKELQVQQRELELQTQLRIAYIGKWWEPSNLAAYVFVAYLAKVVVWDTMLGLGSTPAIKGAVGDWLAMIAVFLFGKRGIENVARILRK